MLTMRERANMSVLLSKLRRLEYVVEDMNPLDARSHLIGLTPKGQDMAEKCKKITDEVSDVIDRFLAGHEEAPDKFRHVMSDLVGKFYSING
jgi:DNA-binding MarR family transcriptional regulator